MTHSSSQQALRHVARLSTGPPVEALLRITLNFHPDRGSILHALGTDGVYFSQFLTGTSNGGLTAHPGGDRWRWEQAMFGGAKDALDDYIEAQVHGEVRLDRDVEALVLDPCYRETDVEAAARRLACPVEWHPGFRLSVAELQRYPDYRGQRYVDLGVRLAENGCLTPRLIGDAARSGHHDQQDLKRVWHYLARFGAPAAPPTISGTGRR
ncbi:DUF3626 domain-containing protein [Actinoplanes regularis]|uniref:Uncharacterized protein n=1 Tax=Actinoplanes regularis TaxID=52697 RepID=A0A239BMP8_9ACTN|nr:DUF3626 domain-containing protein [Actinoplanes regularis]GIE88411.1 hypothetical protein Are01nite_48910 [Actinoplanes regularis]SNS09116.1 Protein of unknown function [Actinoplanes regularis]